MMPGNKASRIAGRFPPSRLKSNPKLEAQTVFLRDTGQSSGIFTRVLFYGYHRLMSLLLKKEELPNLARSLLLLFLLGALCILFLAFRPLDYYQLSYAPSYERPSALYGLDHKGEAVLLTEFYRQARRPISLSSLNEEQKPSLALSVGTTDKQTHKIDSDPSTKRRRRRVSKKEQGYPRIEEPLKGKENTDEMQSSKQKSKDGKTEVLLDMDAKIVRAFLAAEDVRFLYHPGVDLFGIVRAFGVNLLAGKIKEGASTITQQVARLRFLSQERSVLRKLREAFLALLLEIKYTKREIMEDYLNMVPLGHGTNGIEAAARFYFDKSCTQLNWGEAALLASLTTRPRQFSPIANPMQSMYKVKVTLQKLVENGQLTILQAEAAFRALQENFYATLNRSPNDSAFGQRLNLHPYVTAFVRNQLPRELRSNDILSTAGLAIYTSINHKHQSAAEKHMPPYLKKITAQRRRPPFRNHHIFDSDFAEFYKLNALLLELPQFKLKISRARRDLNLNFHTDLAAELNVLSLLAGEANVSRSIDHHLLYGKDFVRQYAVEGALLSIEPYTGKITAVVGGSAFSPNNQQLRFHKIRRQAGSAFKPIVIASALEASLNPQAKQGITAATIFDDTPLHFINRDLSEYSPANYSDSYDGNIRLRKALTLSKNSVSIQVYRRLGSEVINPIAERLLQLDRESPARSLPREATVALGSYGLSPLRMASAYGVFASGGYEISPYVIETISDRTGKLLYDHRKMQKDKKPRRLLSASTAELMVSMLKDVVNKGTGQAAALSGRQVAGKTGTTNLSTDAWFVGFTPALVTAIYIGYDSPSSLGINSTGGSLAAPVWGKYMYEALKGTLPKNYNFKGSQLKKVEICESTGALPGPDCPERITELFLPGTEPRHVKPAFESYSENSQFSEGSENREQEDREADVLNDEDFQF